jgi:transcriptional regulator with XRE-family HTH domain
MPARESARQRGKRLGRGQRRRVGEDLRQARVGVGLSLREVGRRIGLSHSAVARRERGEVETLSIDQVAAMATVLGLDLRVSLYPTGAPVRDAAHLALLDRFRSRLATSVRFRTEVPMPIPGDLRCADGVIDRLRGSEAVVMVEAETRVDDVQALVRRIRIKQRDLAATRVILLLGDTRHHRALTKTEPGLATEFPVAARACLRALADGRDPGGDAILLL